MKKHFYLLGVVLFAMAAPGWCNNQTIDSASAITVDAITGYYSSMATLKNPDQLAGSDINYRDRCEYIKKNRPAIMARVAETRCHDNLGRAVQLIDGLYKNHITSSPHDPLRLRATGQGYFDCITGHRYYKTGAATYAEYTQKGIFLKTVPCDQALLTTNRHIQPVGKDTYILYRKTLLSKTMYMVLPESEPHPEGWKADNLLISSK